MKKMRSFFHSAMGTTFMFMLAVLLLMTGTIGGVRATPQIFNPDFYYGGLELDEIGITLLENGSPVSSRNYNKTKQAFDVSSNNTNNAEQGILLAGMLGSEKLKIGKAYPESLSVRNTGLIPEYVRVTVYKYWVSVDEKGNETRFDAYDAEGKEILNKLIDLNFLQGSDKDWVIDPGATTKERTVLYYKHLLDKGLVVIFVVVVAAIVICFVHLLAQMAVVGKLQKRNQTGLREREHPFAFHAILLGLLGCGIDAGLRQTGEIPIFVNDEFVIGVLFQEVVAKL